MKALPDVILVTTINNRLEITNVGRSLNTPEWQGEDTEENEIKAMVHSLNGYPKALGFS